MAVYLILPNDCSFDWLDEDEMRRYEIEFFEWLGAGSYPDIPWKDYVMKKVRSLSDKGIDSSGHIYLPLPLVSFELIFQEYIICITG